MSKRKDGQVRGKYTLEFKLEAVRLLKGGQAAAMTVNVLGMPKPTLGPVINRARQLQQPNR